MTEDLPCIQRLTFAREFRDPILRGEKTATIRLGETGILADRPFAIRTDAGETLGRAQATHVFETTVDSVTGLLQCVDAKHSVTTGEKTVDEALADHYDAALRPETRVTAIVFDLTKPQARPTMETEA